MSEVFWHLGLTIEPDASGPSTLRIDGENIPVAVSDGVFTSAIAPEIRASSLNELAIRIIDKSPGRCRREFHKSMHLAKLKDGVEACNR